MREWFILYHNSDLEEWAKQLEILDSDNKLTVGFYSLISPSSPKQIYI